MNDLFSLDLKTMVWSEIGHQLVNTIESSELVPRGRSWHSFTPLTDEQIVLFGGFTQDNRPMSDCWIFDIRSLTWNAIDLPFEKPRLWHSATLSPFGESKY